MIDQRATEQRRKRYDRIAPFYDLMDALTPLMRLMGPDINRRTLDNVRAAGLEIEHVEDLGMGGIFKLIVARVPNGKAP